MEKFIKGFKEIYSSLMSVNWEIIGNVAGLGTLVIIGIGIVSIITYIVHFF